MGTPLRLLIIEDVEDHALLMVRELQKAGFDPDFTRAETVQQVRDALDEREWDAIISDFNLPGFDGIEALRMMQEKGLDLPFLLVSGAIGEEKAAEVMKAGAHDYIKKGNYARLAPTLERELRDAKIRRERRQSAEELTRYRERLEELVEERTEELTRANEALQAEVEERRRAEAALRQSEKKFSTIFHAAPSLMVITTLPEGVIVDVNETLLNVLGYAREEIIGRTTREIGVWADPEQRSRMIGMLQEDRSIRNQEMTFVGKSGRRFFGLLSADVIEIDRDRYMLSVLRDITERRQAEEALKNSEEKLRFATQAADIGMWHWNLTSDELTWNDRCLELFGYPPGYPISYDAFLGAIHEEDRPRIDEAVRTSLRERSEYFVELRVPLPEDRVRWVMSKGHAYYDDQGNPVRMHGIAMDITERKRAEAALLRAKEEWEATFASVPDLIAVLDENFTIVRVNPAMAKRLGRQPDECIGLRCYQTLHGGEFPPDFCPHSRTLRDSGAHSAEVHEPRLAGNFLVSTTPLTAADGRVIGTVHVARDITERKQAEEEIARLNADLAARVAELEERNQELEAFNRMVSHDLRQPLNNMALSCQQMEMTYGEDEELCRESIASLYNGVMRMNTLIDTLLNFSRSTHADLQREDFDISAMAQAILDEARSAEPGRVVRTEVEPGLVANGDPSLLRAVLENLIGNAWKYTGKREQAFIGFGAGEAGGERAFFVRDNGKGFDMADAGKLFLPFQRLGDAEEFKGTGIGLATVERIIRRHGGRVWAEGEPDAGATFYFTLGSAR